MNFQYDELGVHNHESFQGVAMYTTIEPRLIALLNNDPPPEPFPTSTYLELPSLREANILSVSGRPLLLEPNASHSTSKRGTNASRNGSPAPSGPEVLADESKESKRVGMLTERALGNSSPQALRKILDDLDDLTTATVPSKKRNVPEANNDEFVQLPQPPKKHKVAKQVVPPIINGLYEPPPQAALFPPIASSSFHDSHGRNTLNTVVDKAADATEKSRSDDAPPEADKEPEPTSHKTKTVRARKKWTEDETRNLLLGVSKHGVGNWADILEDGAFTFNNRSGVDLKDRFRTCCPAELQDKLVSGSKTSVPALANVPKPGNLTSSFASENILIDKGDLQTRITGSGSFKETQRGTRTHRKKLEDLQELGIERPFRKSQRRERNRFSEDDDREILEGYHIYGPAWTRIQRDSRFHLSNRQATDLRDRFRNKFSEKLKTENSAKDCRQTELVTTDQPDEALQSSLLFQGIDTRETDVTAASNQTTASLTKTDDKVKDLSIDSIMSLSCAKSDIRENEVLQTTMAANFPPPNLHQSTSRERLKIQQMISSEYEKPQSSLAFTTKDIFTPYGDHSRNTESNEDLSYSHALDWSSSIAAPFGGNIGEMDISRLLMDDTWMVNPSAREKQNVTDINSILTSDAEVLSHGHSFYNMLDSDSMNVHTATLSDHDGSFG